jgi:hypothetical protein
MCKCANVQMTGFGDGEIGVLSFVTKIEILPAKA